MPDELDKILEDAFEMGVNHGKGLWDDFPQLKKGMEAKLNALFLSQALDLINGAATMNIGGVKESLINKPDLIAAFQAKYGGKYQWRKV